MVFRTIRLLPTYTAIHTLLSTIRTLLFLNRGEDRAYQSSGLSTHNSSSHSVRSGCIALLAHTLTGIFLVWLNIV